MSRHLAHHQRVQDLMLSHVDFVAVLIVDMHGSAPQEPGAKMLVTHECIDSPIEGTVGGGKLELFAINHAKKLLADPNKKSTEILTLNLQTDVGMTCGGVVQLFFETHRHNQWHIAVFGAGHVAQALIPLLLTLNCQVHCIDERADWLTKLPSNPALNIINDHLSHDALKQLPADSHIISVTQGHCEDVKIITTLLQNRHPPYIGIIGSDSKAVLLKKELKSMGVNSAVIDQIHCPIGLPIGADIPAEIAISIVAQLLAVRDNQ